jgi:mono/diheme cytochrome c family protein
LAGTLFLALVAMASGAEPVGARAKSVLELKAFYGQNCTRCHGLDGSARTPDGKNLGGVDFTKAATDFRARSGSASEREIRAMSRTIRKGILFGFTMPGWKDQLTDEEATLMVREILLKAVPGKVITAETGATASK